MDISTYLKFWAMKPEERKKIITHHFKTVFDITYASFTKEGIKLFIFDIDDTLTEHLGLIRGDVYNLIERIHKKGMKVGIYSNCKPERYQQLLEIFKEYPEIHIVDTPKKPNPGKYIEITNNYSVKPEQAVMVGDKVGTDLFGAFLAGYKYRILVEPYSSIIGGKPTTKFQQFMRSLEKKFSA